MSDLISREYMKSLGATCIASRSKDGNMFPIVSIDELPSAQPEIIRCKDCIHNDRVENSDGRYWCDLHAHYMYYCSDGELRGDSDEN